MIPHRPRVLPGAAAHPAARSWGMRCPASRPWQLQDFQHVTRGQVRTRETHSAAVMTSKRPNAKLPPGTLTLTKGGAPKAASAPRPCPAQRCPRRRGPPRVSLAPAARLEGLWPQRPLPPTSKVFPVTSNSGGTKAPSGSSGEGKEKASGRTRAGPAVKRKPAQGQEPWPPAPQGPRPAPRLLLSRGPWGLCRASEETVQRGDTRSLEAPRDAVQRGGRGFSRLPERG